MMLESLLLQCTLHRSSENYFSPGEYLLGDAAYTNTNYIVSPYKVPLTQEPSNCHFNRKLSSLRIDIEHTFGILKGRWAVLWVFVSY